MSVVWTPSPARRGLAVLASILLPGAGQIILGRPRWALLWFFLPVVLMALVPTLGLIGAIGVLLCRLGSAAQAAVMHGPDGQPDAARVALLTFALLIGSFTILASLKRDVVENVTLADGSMYPSLEAGDYVVVDKAAYGWRLPFSQSRVGGDRLAVGDLVGVDHPDRAGELLMARLVAIGPTDVMVADGVVVVGGEPMVRRAVEGTCSYLDFEDGKLLDRTCTRFEEGAGERRWQTVIAEGATPAGLALREVAAGQVMVALDNRGGEKPFRVMAAGAVRGKASLVWFSTAGPKGVRWWRVGARPR